MTTDKVYADAKDGQRFEGRKRAFVNPCQNPYHEFSPHRVQTECKSPPPRMVYDDYPMLGKMSIFVPNVCCAHEWYRRDEDSVRDNCRKCSATCIRGPSPGDNKPGMIENYSRTGVV